MKARQATIVKPFKVEVREVELPDPKEDQILVAAEYSAVSPGTELAVYTGTHQWLQDPNMPDWKFPFRSGYSAAGTVVAVGSNVPGLKAGDKVSFPGNHASAELLTLSHERGKAWKLPDGLETSKAAIACILRYGMGASIRPGLTLGRSAAVLGLGMIGQASLRCLLAAGANPVVGIDSVEMRRKAALAAGADFVADPTQPDFRADQSIPWRQGSRNRCRCDRRARRHSHRDVTRLRRGSSYRRREPTRTAKDVNFYDDLHRRYIEVAGAHGNMLFEAAHTRLAGAWDIHKARRWLLASLAKNRLSLEKLVTHRIKPEQLGDAYDGLLNREEEYLAVVVDWS